LVYVISLFYNQQGKQLGKRKYTKLLKTRKANYILRADVMADCLTGAVYDNSTELVVARNDDGSISSLVKGWEHMHWITHIPSLHKLNVLCAKLTGRHIWGEQIRGSSTVFQVSPLSYLAFCRQPTFSDFQNIIYSSQRKYKDVLFTYI
jgi:hypothetical protein